MQASISNSLAFVRRFRLLPLIGLSFLFGDWPVLLAAGPLTYSLSSGHESWPPEVRQRIDDSMAEAVALYNVHGHFEKHVTANYVPSVATADGNYNGSIRFGSNQSFMTTRTALHEIAHTLGVGTVWQWNNNRSGNLWTGAHALHQLRQFNGPEANLNADQWHFWPYGLNQEGENSALNRVRHIKMVAAFRRDMNLVETSNGLPADWVDFHFASRSRVRADTDSDRDGVSNLEEYWAGTDPTDPLDYPGARGRLVHHWQLNEGPVDPGFARLEPSLEPATSRRAFAVVGARVGPAAFFQKGGVSRPGPIYAEAAAQGGWGASGSVGSYGTDSPVSRIELGPLVPGSAPFTWALWFKRNGQGSRGDLGSEYHILGADQEQNGRWSLRATTLEPGEGLFDLEFHHEGVPGWSRGRNFSRRQGLASDVWYHWAATRDESGTFRMYLNGETIFSGTNQAEFTQGSRGVMVGRDASFSVPARSFLGWFDDIRFYNHALESEEVRALMAPLPGYGNWVARHFTEEEALDPVVSGMQAAPIGDGVSNFLKYAFGLPPKAPATSADLPQVMNTVLGPSLSYVRRRDAGDVRYRVEFSQDLVSWEPAPALEEIEVEEGRSTDTVTVGWAALEETPRGFFRVRAEWNE